MEEPRIVCVGANLESEVALKALLEAGANLAVTITVPARTVAGISDYRDLHPLCESAGIPVIDTVDINAQHTLQALRAIEPDYIFVLGWSQIFKRELLDLPRGYVIGSHPTALPLRRGRAPVPWTVLENYSESAVTLFRMSAGVDNGPIFLQQRFTIKERPYAMDVYQSVAEALGESFVILYRSLCDGTIAEKPQTNDSASYRAKRVPADGHIDFISSAEWIDRLVRAVSEPFPGAYTYFNDELIHVWRAKPYKGPERRGVPGQILAKQEDWLIVQAGDVPICLSTFTQLAEPVPLSHFPLGSVFGYRLEDTLADLRNRVMELEKKQ